MTKINKMVMYGFKSFAKRIEIPFGDQYNCILGPNGSGKSNVLDSLCFVLGKSSSKSLRAEKSANLIYNGGKSKKPAKSGEVSIYFDNSNKEFPVDSKEIKITRIVKHTGQSVYKINDKTRTRQEVLDLLNHANITPDSYNIILQGDIVRFVEMHPVERRQLIEGISGISVYEEKKKKAMSELGRVDDRLKETEIVLTERSSYLKELKKERDQALKYKDMNDKIKHNKASYLKIQIDKKEKEHSSIKERIEKANQEIKKLNDKVEDLRKQNKEKKDIIKEINKEIEESGEVEQVKLNREVESLKIETTKISSRIDTCKNEITKINQRKEDLDKEIKEIDEKISVLKKEKEDSEKRINSIKKERNEFTEKLSAFRKKNKLDNIGDMETEIEEIDKRSDELQKEINSLRERQHKIIREKDIITHEINTIDDKIEKVKEIEKENKNQLDELKNKRIEFKNSVMQLNKCLDEDSSFSVKLNSIRKDINSSTETLEKLRARDIGRREITHADMAVKKIIELKEKIRGIYGTVADLGNVSSKYSLALEIAAGTRIKSIVVADDKVASQCIKYLKQNRLGIATFLPINKIRPKPENPAVKKLASSNGVHGTALSLVSFDSKFKNIFSYVFGDSVVIDNIDVARRLGIGTAKFVTLDGDIAESSGVMQGGFRGKRKGMGFKEKDLTDDIKRLEANIAGLMSEKDNVENKRAKNEEDITRLREKKAELEGEIIKTEKSLHLEHSDTDASKEKKKDLQKKDSELDSEIQKISMSVSKLNRELAQLKIKKQESRSRITQLRNPRLLAELNTYEEKIKQFNEDIIKITSETKGLDTQIKSIYEPEKEKTAQIIKQIEKEEENFIKEKEELSKKVIEKNKILKEKEEKAQEFYSKFKGLFAKRSKIDDEISKNEIEINNKLNDSRNIEVKNNTFSLKNAGLSAELSGLEAEFKQYEGIKIDSSKSEEELKREINKFERLRENIGSVNMRALEIYEEVEKQYKELQDKKEKLTKEKEDVLSMMQEIETKKKGLFMETLNVVNDNFKRFFSALSSKGDANLLLENPEDPFEGGLRVNVKITGSKFMDIRGLSGGEKTMTALAFIFAIQEHEPASFYVLDEVDAALDKHNSEKLAKLVRKYSDRAQYIIISHNDSVISEADNLYGISMDEHGISKVVSLKI